MPSPFPGMDPYIEAPARWSGFHHNLTTEVLDQVSAKLGPRYFADVEIYFSYEPSNGGEIRVIAPDVSVAEIGEVSALSQDSGVLLAEAPMKLRLPIDLPTKSFSVVIRDADNQRLVTSIELLSPANKRPSADAYRTYHRKRRDILRSEAHLLEIDLLRAGERPPLADPMPEAPYFVVLSRAGQRPMADVWPLHLQDSFPIIPVPLLEPDPDIPLHLGVAVATVYDRLAYERRIDYREPPPPPPLPADDAAWLDERVRQAGLRA